MRILYITSRFPYPALSGDRVRAYNQLRLLSKEHQIILLSPIKTPEEYAGLDHIRSFCESVEVFPKSFFRDILNLIKIPFSSIPWQVTYYCDGRIRTRIRDLLKTERFDVAHTQLARTAPLLDSIDTVPKVIDLIDALSLNMQRRSESQTGVLSWLAASEAKRMKAYEQKLINQFDHLVVVSDVDRQVIGDFPNLHAIPLGVDLSEFSFQNNQRRAHEVVFTGNMGYFPNINAVQYFASEVLPLIKKENPAVQFTVVGVNPPQSLQDEYPDIKFTGYVPRLHDYLSRASVAVAPMRSGSGMQFKIIEAMATGTPVVTTSYGIGGINARHDQHFFIEDTAEDFARTVVRLLADKDLCTQISMNARDFVQENYSWESSVRGFEKLYLSCVDNFRPEKSDVLI
jgi:polysaccharide biosynthesis protein PslH